MYHLTLRSEYSFKQTFSFLQEIHDNYSHNNVIGIADTNTLGFYKLYELCKNSGKKAIYGLRISVVKDATEKVKPRGQFGKPYIIIAKNYSGLQEIFMLSKIQSSESNFYYRGNVSCIDIDNLTDNVFVVSTDPIANRLDFIGIDHTTIPKVLEYDYPKLFVDNNNFLENEMRKIYELMLGNSSDNKTYPQHALYQEEIRGFGVECVDNLQVVVDACENIELRKAENIRYKGEGNIVDLCKEGAIKKNIDLTDEIYKARFEREINLLQEKDYGDYLLVVADLIKQSKKFCLVGGGRGSSAGSLVCYLLDITEVDPLVHGLIFERFVDINRYDPPDVDTDFPDKARAKVVKYLEKTYGIDNVKTISTISKYKPKVTIGEFAKHMEIPKFETEAVKDVIIERAGGDARASFCLEDTLLGTDVGKEFIAKYPQMINVKYAEGHAKQKGKHAAGVIVCNEPIVEYCGIDMRDGTAMLDKKDAEKLNLLKIDVLGLRTLSVLQDCAKAIGMDYREYYKLPLDDEKAYKVFQSKRLGGIFQFEGEAMKSINDSAPMEKFTDIVAAGALGRPGALSSGGTSRYVQLRNGTREPLYYCDEHKKLTEESYGIVIYQEQMMWICKNVAGMTWEDVSDLRKAASKSLGEEFFDKYRIKFVEGACKISGYDEEKANKAWLDISSMGCLSGGTIIKNPFVNQNQPQAEITLQQLYESNGFSSKSRYEDCLWKKKNGYNTKDCLKQNIFMVCDDGAIRPKRLVDIYKSGIKETFELKVKTENGDIKSIRATKNHKFMIPGMSFKPLSELDIGDSIIMISYKKRKSRRYKGTGSGAHNHTGDRHTVIFNNISKKMLLDYPICQTCNVSPSVETHHIDGNYLNNEDGNHTAICRSCHRKAHTKLGNNAVPHKRGKMQEFATVVSIDNPKHEMTYDISMPSPNNFIANDFAVHNSYAFNKSHSVVYGQISYWCAYMKAHHPLEFIASILNNAKDDDSSLKILREFYESENLIFKAVDPWKSNTNWEIIDGTLLGGLTNIKGIGSSKALNIMSMRRGKKPFTPAMKAHMENPKTPFDILYPARHHWGQLYRNPSEFGLTSIDYIRDVEEARDYAIIGKMIHIDDVNVNDIQSIAKRGGEVLDGPTMKVHVRLEDDTGVMMCIVNRFVYEQLSQDFLREKVGDTWFCVIGKVMSGAKILFVKEVANLNRDIGLNESEEER